LTIVVVMGVSGSGKTLARLAGLPATHRVPGTMSPRRPSRSQRENADH
jgi:hypothetical protein